MKQQLIKHLQGGEAFMPIDQVLEEVTFEQLGIRPEALAYSFYELFYHMVFAQRDILNYLKADDYVAPQWPDAYWPEKQAPEAKTAWDALQKQFFDDREALIAFVENPNHKLDECIKNSKEHTLLRELMLVIEHNAYHNGQLLVLLRLLSLHS